MRFEIRFTGHQNVRSLHQRTIEITKDSHLTPQGDCIIGVNASCSCAEIPQEIKEKIRNPDSKIRFSVIVQDNVFELTGKGSQDLLLEHESDIVVRKSDFVCPRTLAVRCDKSSNDIPRDMIKLLQNPRTVGTFLIEIMDDRTI